MDRWLTLDEVAKLLGLSKDSVLRLARNHRLPLRRVSPHAVPGCLASELLQWLKTRPRTGPPVRPS